MNCSSRLTNQQALNLKPIFTELCPAWLARSFKSILSPLKKFQWCLRYTLRFLLILDILYFIQSVTYVQLETFVTVHCALGATLCSYCLEVVMLWTTFESTFHSILLWVAIYTVTLIGKMNADQRKFVESQCACSNATKST
jgi:hypothetical protein